MQNTIIKTLIKISLISLIVLYILEISDFYNSIMNKRHQTKVTYAAQKDSPQQQYIPENLDYSKIINEIKKQEGIFEEEPETEKETEKISETTESNKEDYSLMKEEFSSPTEYMKAAKEYVKAAINTTDITEQRFKVKKAFNCYKEYLKYKPGDIEGLLGAGAMAIYLEREEDAKNILMEAYATYPKNPRVHKALGDYSFKFSNYNNAIEYYNLSLLSGNLEDYATNLATAVCYEKLGDIEKAIEYFKVAQHLNPESEIANQRLEMYNKMERDGYYTDSRMYDDAFKPSEEDDIELQTLILDSQQIK